MAKQSNMALWIGVIVVIVILIGGYWALSGKGAPSKATTTVSSGGGGGGGTTSKGTTTTPSNTATTTVAQIQSGIPLNVTLTEWAITPSALTVKTGASIILKVKNAGTIGHNLQITAVGSTGNINPGQLAYINFTAPAPGNYTMNDYQYLQYGMVGTLTVTK